MKKRILLTLLAITLVLSAVAVTAFAASYSVVTTVVSPKPTTLEWDPPEVITTGIGSRAHALGDRNVAFTLPVEVESKVSVYVSGSDIIFTGVETGMKIHYKRADEAMYTTVSLTSSNLSYYYYDDAYYTISLEGGVRYDVAVTYKTVSNVYTINHTDGHTYKYNYKFTQSEAVQVVTLALEPYGKWPTPDYLTVENGVITGMEAGKTYEYAPVSVPDGVVGEYITYYYGEVLDAGTYCVRVAEGTDGLYIFEASDPVVVFVEEEPVVLESITVTAPAKTVYYTSDTELDLTGFNVIANYSDGSTEVVTDEVSLSEVDFTNVGTQNVDVTYLDKTDTFQVSVQAVVPTEIIVTPPEKLIYNKGDKLDTTGMVVTANFNNGTTATVTDYTVAPSTFTVAGNTVTVTVTYEGVSDSFDVTVYVASGVCGDNLTWIIEADGVLTISGEGAMYDYTTTDVDPDAYGYEYMTDAPWWNYSFNKVVIEDGVTTVGNNAFNSKSLDTVVMGNGVEKIGVAAFCACYNLTDVTFGSNVTEIGAEAFQDCQALADIVIPDSVKTVGKYAYRLCVLAKTLTIGKGVETIGEAAFSFCMNLGSISVAEENPCFTNDANRILYDKDMTQIILCPAKVFCTEFEVPETVMTINAEAFAYCKGLTAVTVWGSVTEIGKDAFKSCNALTLYGHKATTVETYAIENDIPFVAIPLYDGTVGTIVWEIHGDGELIIKGEGKMKDYTKVKTAPWAKYAEIITAITVGDGVEAIGNLAFNNLENAEVITVADSVKRVGTQAFGGTAIKEIALGGVTVLRSMAFALAGSLEKVTLPESLTDIHGNVFYSETVNVTAPVNSYAANYAENYSEYYSDSQAVVTLTAEGESTQPVLYYGKAGEDVFYAIYKIAEGNYKYEISGYGEMTSFAYPSAKNVAAGKTMPPAYTLNGEERNIKSISVLGGVTTVGDYTFYKCTKAKYLDIHNAVTSIGIGAFMNCQRLESINLPTSLETLGAKAFGACSKLADITFPETVNGIGAELFTKLDNLSGITVDTDNQTVIDYITAYYPEITLK